jgi:hypothetical protein
LDTATGGLNVTITSKVGLFAPGERAENSFCFYSTLVSSVVYSNAYWSRVLEGLPSEDVMLTYIECEYGNLYANANKKLLGAQHGSDSIPLTP